MSLRRTVALGAGGTDLGRILVVGHDGDGLVADGAAIARHERRPQGRGPVPGHGRLVRLQCATGRLGCLVGGAVQPRLAVGRGPGLLPPDHQLLVDLGPLGVRPLPGLERRPLAERVPSAPLGLDRVRGGPLRGFARGEPLATLGDPLRQLVDAGRDVHGRQQAGPLPQLAPGPLQLVAPAVGGFQLG